MEAKLKQRVVGALVLTTLAIIILPMLLDGSAEHRAQVEASIPAPPQIELEQLTVADLTARQAEMIEASERQMPVLAEDTIDAPAENFSLNVNRLPVSWTLQLGSFRDEANAVRLRQSLREAEYRSYILTADAAGNEVYRVYVGPMLDRDMLQSASQQIEARFELKGKIIRFRLEDDRHQLGG